MLCVSFFEEFICIDMQLIYFDIQLIKQLILTLICKHPNTKFRLKIVYDTFKWKIKTSVIFLNNVYNVNIMSTFTVRYILDYLTARFKHC